MTATHPAHPHAPRAARPRSAQTTGQGAARGFRRRRALPPSPRSTPTTSDADAATFALHDAQLVLARAYGFESWPKLKAFVDGVTVERLVEAVRAGDIDGVRAMLDVRPELVRIVDGRERRASALHHAVLSRSPEMVRLLMQHGADARQGIYPHRDATSPLTIAVERGYDEIVAHHPRRGRTATARRHARCVATRRRAADDAAHVESADFSGHAGRGDRHAGIESGARPCPSPAG